MLFCAASCCSVLQHGPPLPLCNGCRAPAAAGPDLLSPSPGRWQRGDVIGRGSFGTVTKPFGAVVPISTRTGVAKVYRTAGGTRGTLMILLRSPVSSCRMRACAACPRSARVVCVRACVRECMCVRARMGVCVYVCAFRWREGFRYTGCLPPPAAGLGSPRATPAAGLYCTFRYTGAWTETMAARLCARALRAGARL